MNESRINYFILLVSFRPWFLGVLASIVVAGVSYTQLESLPNFFLWISIGTGVSTTLLTGFFSYISLRNKVEKCSFLFARGFEMKQKRNKIMFLGYLSGFPTALSVDKNRQLGWYFLVKVFTQDGKGYKQVALPQGQSVEEIKGGILAFSTKVSIGEIWKNEFNAIQTGCRNVIESINERGLIASDLDIVFDLV